MFVSFFTDNAVLSSLFGQVKIALDWPKLLGSADDGETFDESSSSTGTASTDLSVDLSTIEGQDRAAFDWLSLHETKPKNQIIQELESSNLTPEQKKTVLFILDNMRCVKRRSHFKSKNSLLNNTLKKQFERSKIEK